MSEEVNGTHPAERKLARMKADLTKRVEGILEQLEIMAARLRLLDEKVEQLEQDRDRWKHLANRRQETIKTLTNKYINVNKENK